MQRPLNLKAKWIGKHRAWAREKQALAVDCLLLFPLAGVHCKLEEGLSAQVPGRSGAGDECERDGGPMTLLVHPVL